MSGVDVLAVMDEVAHYHDNGSEAFDSLREARAAVAELIEAVDRMERKAVEQARLTSSVFNSDIARVRAALSRVRGSE